MFFQGNSNIIEPDQHPKDDTRHNVHHQQQPNQQQEELAVLFDDGLSFGEGGNSILSAFEDDHDYADDPEVIKAMMDDDSFIPIDSNTAPAQTSAAIERGVSVISHTSIGAKQSDTPNYKGLSGRNPMQLYLSCNDDNLSQYQCIVRKQIEYFEAKDEDVNTVVQGRNRPIILGQVGIRCRHCTFVPPSQRTHGAVYYPTKLQGIYQACQTMASSHLLENCPNIPTKIRYDLIQYKDNPNVKKSIPGGGKEYWAQLASVLGVYEDTDDSILRFDPEWVTRVIHHADHPLHHQTVAQHNQKENNSIMDSSISTATTTSSLSG